MERLRQTFPARWAHENYSDFFHRSRVNSSFVCPRAHADEVLGPDLSTFAVLGGTPVVSFAAGNDTITGNVGVYPAASIAGTFTLTGTQHAGDATALAAQAGLTNALTVLGLGVRRNLAE